VISLALIPLVRFELFKDRSLVGLTA